MTFWLILWIILAVLLYTLIRAGAKKQPKPPRRRREGWVTTEDGPYYKELGDDWPDPADFEIHTPKF